MANDFMLDIKGRLVQSAWYDFMICTNDAQKVS